MLANAGYFVPLSKSFHSAEWKLRVFSYQCLRTFSLSPAFGLAGLAPVLIR